MGKVRAFKSAVCVILCFAVVFLCACEGEKNNTGNAIFIGKTIGAVSGTDEYDVAVSYESVCDRVVGYYSFNSALYALKSNKVDYVIADEPTAYKAVRENDKLKVVTKCIPTVDFCAYFPKESKYFDLFNEAVAALYEDGTANKLCESYKTGEEYTPKRASTGERIVLATTVSGFPFCEKSADELSGIDIYMAYEIAAYLGLSLEIRAYEFEGMLEAVLSGEADFAMGATVPENSRESDFLVSSPYYTLSYAVIGV